MVLCYVIHSLNFFAVWMYTASYVRALFTPCYSHEDLPRKWGDHNSCSSQLPCLPALVSSSCSHPFTKNNSLYIAGVQWIVVEFTVLLISFQDGDMMAIYEPHAFFLITLCVEESLKAHSYWWSPAMSHCLIIF